MTRAGLVLPALSGLLLAGACGPVLAPAGLIQLEAEWEAVEAELLAEAAPESHREATAWLERAREALDGGDVEAAERFAGLGSIALRTAALHLRRLELAARVGAKEDELASLEHERERLEDALELARREEERRRLRAHIEGVVDEVRRRAAADDEIRDARLVPEERAALEGARLAIAVELTARARVALGVLLGLADTGVLIAEQSIPVRRDIDRVLEAMTAGDLAAAQEHCESAGVHARRMIDDAFDGGTGGFSARLDGLLAAVRDVPGWEDRASVEEFGIGLSMPVRFTAAGALERGSDARLERAAESLLGLPVVSAVLVIASRGRDPGAPKAAARADASARAVADVMRPLLVRGERRIPVLPVTGIGGATPVAALGGKGADRLALLLIPLPASGTGERP